jgi:hypothetical protein
MNGDTDAAKSPPHRDKEQAVHPVGVNEHAKSNRNFQLLQVAVEISAAAGCALAVSRPVASLHNDVHNFCVALALARRRPRRI